MPRIRTVKPEFWDSPSTARASAVARLLYIAMWNWADDYGRGTANLKELEGFAFPNDDVEELSGGKSRKFRDTVEEVSECFGVVFYTVRGRPYYAIPSWDDHQKTERKARSKHPGPDEADSPPDKGKQSSGGNSSTFRRDAEEAPISSGAGTGEEGNRGIEEQKEDREPTVRSTAVAATTPRPEIEQLCEHLADRIEANGSKRPSITKRWEDACRLMLDRDGRTTEQISYLIDWSQAHEFWKSNILSMPKLRDKFDQLRLQATAKPGGQSKSDQRAQNILRMVEDMEGEPGGHESNWRGAGVHQSA